MTKNNKTKQFGENVDGYQIPVLNEREIRAAAGIPEKAACPVQSGGKLAGQVEVLNSKQYGTLRQLTP